LSSTAAEGKTVSATVNGTALPQTAAVTVTAGTVSATLSTVAAAPASITASGAPTTITVTAKDGSGNPISGATVVLAATGSGNTLTQPAGPTNASGVATGTLSSTVAEGKTVSATVNGTALTQTAAVTVTTGAVSATVSTVAAAPASIAAGGGTSTITVTAKDGSGNPISGATVVLAATGSGNTLTQPASPTNASGVATGTLSSTVAEGKTVSATVNGTALTGTATVTVTSGGVSVTLSTVAVSPASITAGNGAATITVTAKDAAGNPISGATVLLAATGSGNTLTQPAAATDANGVATGALSSTVAEGKTVSATVNGAALTQTASVTVTAGAVAAAQSAVATTPGIIVIGGQPATITVTARDANGNPVSGATVGLAATGSGNTLAQPVGPTNASGVATGSLSSSVSEVKTVSATINGLSLTQTPNVTVGVAFTGAGSIATCSRLNDEATANLLDTIPGTVFTAGDNVSSTDLLSDFQNCYQPSWGRQKARTRPSIGDKEYQVTGAAGYWQYFGAVTGDSGKYYYSYDLGAWHIIALNSEIDMSAGSPQEQWLKADLAASTKQCTLAYWHSQLFSSSGTSYRTAVVPLWNDLYAAGAEIVVNGHARLYERFAPQTPTGALDQVTGIRQFTVGTGGYNIDTFGTIRPNSEVRNSGTYGVLKLTLLPGSYAWQFYPVAGQSFTDSGSGSCH
jgi:acid phosphatase type 7